MDARREVTPEVAEKAPGYRWVVFGLWSVCVVSGYMVMGTIGLLLPAITSELRLSPTEQGIVGSAGFWGAIALAIPLGLWASRFRPKPLTTVTMLLGALFVLVQGWAPVFAILILGRVAFGISHLAREPARALLIRQWFPAREVVLAQTVNNAAFGIFVGGGLLLTPFILSGLRDDWRGTMYVFSAFLLALTVLWMVFGKERGSVESQPFESQTRGVLFDRDLLRSALAHRDVWVAGLGFLGATTAWSAFISFYPTLMLDAYQVSLRWSGAILAISVLIGGFSGFGAGYIATVLGNRRAMLQVLGIVMTGTLVGMTLIGSIPQDVLMSYSLLGLTVLNGITWGFWPVLHSVPFQIDGMRTREIAISMAFIMVMISLGQAIGPLLTGLLQDALGNLKIALILASFGPLSLTVAGTALRPLGRPRPVERASEAGRQPA